MTIDYCGYIQDLLNVITLHEASDRSEMELIESCFKASLEVWGRLQREIKRQEFETAEDEIYFFRKIKPRIMAHIEYYTCRYHALLFRPTDDAEELTRFWNWELRKIDKFFELNHSFCDYIRKGLTDKDSTYFLRGGEGMAQILTGRVHDLDPETATTGDYLASMMIAYEWYEAFVREELKNKTNIFR